MNAALLGLEIHTLSDLLKIGGSTTPDKNAFISFQGELSYDLLDRNSTKIAKFLVANKINKGDRVGVLMGKSLFSPMAVYGILKSGAILVPLDPNLSILKLEAIISDCNMSAIITTPDHEDMLAQLSTEDTLCIGLPLVNSWKEVLDVEEKHAILPPILPSDLAYIIYTSGSTGEPKGIVHTHSSGLAYAKQSVALYEVTSADVVGNVAALNFDQSTFGYFSAMFAGCSTYLFSEGELIMLASFCEAIRQNRISILYSVPSLFISLVDSGLELYFPSLRWVKYGGESYPPHKLNELVKRVSPAKISNVYGPAEINQCTYKTIDCPVSEDNPVPIGKVWANTQYEIIDINGNPVKENDLGELIVSSTTMMYGYWNNEKLNHNSFITREVDGKLVKFYKTGDWVYSNEQGELVFSDRRDRQVKIKGVRIELIDVENTISKLENIIDAAVFTIGEAATIQLCAAVVTKDNAETGELKKTLRHQISKYSMPEHFLQLSKLPRSANGKIDYLKLKKDFILDNKMQTL